MILFRHFLISIACLLVLGLGSSLAHGQDLIDVDGGEWDVSRTSGRISDGGFNGVTDSYDGFGDLCIRPAQDDTNCSFSDNFSASSADAVDGPNGELFLGTDTLQGLTVTRRHYASRTGEGWLRIIDILENETAAPITVQVRFDGNLGSDSATEVIATDNGTLNASSVWLITDDPGSAFDDDPALGFVVRSATRPAAVVRFENDPVWGFGPDNPTVDYAPITIAPGQTVAYMNFLLQRAVSADVQTDIGTITGLTAEQLVGIEPALRLQVQNFLLGDPANCGNGTIDPGEECDDMNMDQTDACTNFCLNARCGDGFAQAGVEACDDGNGINTDMCTTLCEAPACGDGFVQGDEACDDGDENSDVLADACRTTCVEASCTDGVVDFGEMCDDGNDIDGDECSNMCQTAECGDGIVQDGLGEECDDGNDFPRDACTAMCLNAVCGDSIVRLGVEDCDDGNDVDDDGCSNTCEATICGDGEVTGGEECDNANENSDTEPNACRLSCENASCGDGVVDMGEACDDGDEDDSDQCTNACQVAVCGDGIKSTEEACDEGEMNGSAIGRCNAECDGFVRPGETMDAGPVGTDAGPVGTDAGPGMDAGNGGGTDAGPGGGPGGGSGCAAAGGTQGAPWALLGLLAFVGFRRRRR